MRPEEVLKLGGRMQRQNAKAEWKGRMQGRMEYALTAINEEQQ